MHYKAKALPRFNWRWAACQMRCGSNWIELSAKTVGEMRKATAWRKP